MSKMVTQSSEIPNSVETTIKFHWNSHSSISEMNPNPKTCLQTMVDQQVKTSLLPLTEDQRKEPDGRKTPRKTSFKVSKGFL